ncbi:MAG TPA: helix-turn-helix domain-containing protein [Nitrososphaerales archaeon]|nr:helix-turn-helix domain-containing protein [Nitrososphaerales archaeon]
MPQLRAFKYIRDPRAFEVIADPTRRQIIYLLRAKEHSVSQIAESLGKTPQAIYHQIGKLLEVGLIEVSREERIGHFIETYYRATAEVFEFHHGETSRHESEAELRESIEALSRVGIVIVVDQEFVDAALVIKQKSHTLGLKPELEEKISRMEDVGFMTKQDAYKYAQLVTMTDKQFEEMLGAERALRDLLISGTSKAKKKQKLAEPAPVSP